MEAPPITQVLSLTLKTPDLKPWRTADLEGLEFRCLGFRGLGFRF